VKLKIKNSHLFAFPVFGVLILDQASKLLATRFFPIACNKGGAFGLGGNFVVISSIVLVVVFWLILREKNRLSIVGLSLIFGGGLSNLFDRLLAGCVRDFVNFKVFPSFNLADAAITIGAVLIFYHLVFVKKDETKV